jgi:radical SAM/Cys-rich protein
MPDCTGLARRATIGIMPEGLRVLNGTGAPACFGEVLRASGIFPLTASGIRVFQINVGRLCNQTCHHCHVDAGPHRREIMSRETAEACMAALARTTIPTVDITGGAPELNPNFRWLVTESKRLGRHVMDRCNLTVLLLPSQAGLAAFLAEHRVEIVASLPCYTASNTDAQRGEGVFRKSIEALRMLNAAGYGQPDSGLLLNLVYNPGGASLPPPQEALEADYRRELRSGYGLEFNSLYTMTNMPINRFRDFLVASGRHESYMQKLADAYNPGAAQAVMCRSMISVGWDGALYDCDFNQMLGMPVNHGAPAHVREFDAAVLARREIVTGEHCFGCTAGAGSSCTGSTAG